MNWIPLNKLNQLEEIVAKSHTSPCIIFKHSTRCGVSSFALREFEKEINVNPTEVNLYLLDLLRYRNISNQIAVLFEVEHQSPQLLYIANGVCSYHASHSSIDAKIIASL